jgi:hypothetical protein
LRNVRVLFFEDLEVTLFQTGLGRDAARRAEASECLFCGEIPTDMMGDWVNRRQIPRAAAFLCVGKSQRREPCDQLLKGLTVIDEYALK